MMDKILIVEDDKDLITLLKSGLSKNGYQVRATISCKEGLEIFYQFLPDLVILDINVGNEDGREMCRQVKASAEFQLIPVIMISANDISLELYKDYGANDILKKPFLLAQIQKLISKYLPIKPGYKC